MNCSECGTQLIEDSEASTPYKIKCPNCGDICKTNKDHDWRWWSRWTFQCTKCLCLGEFEDGYVIERDE